MPVHPRVCGEHFSTNDRSQENCGSSPRMRGTRNKGSAEKVHGRFIPAYAGNTEGVGVGHCLVPVHPRVCGEHALPQSHTHIQSGSSPRMRGTRPVPRPRPEPSRFIPAYAGNTSCRTASCVHASVHPRVCGEHVRAVTGLRVTAGSSPRMRGTRHARRITDGRLRFIPAYAGNTYCYGRIATRFAVHPRVCGEHP